MLPEGDPFDVAAASIACILAVAAAAAIAAAVGSEATAGKGVGNGSEASKQFGGVIARETRSLSPARSKKFMAEIASTIDCSFSYSKKEIYKTNWNCTTTMLTNVTIATMFAHLGLGQLTAFDLAKGFENRLNVALGQFWVDRGDKDAIEGFGLVLNLFNNSDSLW